VVTHGPKYECASTAYEDGVPEMKSRQDIVSAISLSIIVILLASSPALADVKTKTVTYKDGDVALEGFLVWNDAQSEKRPGVLVTYEWWGQTEESQERARRVAEAGYVAFVPDMYGEGKSTGDPAQAKEWTMGVTGDEALWNRRAQLGLDVLTAQPHVDSSKLAVIGSSFGGSTALQMAYAGFDIKAAVSIGSTLPIAPDTVTSIKPRLLVLHGRNDQYVKPEHIEKFMNALDKANANWEMTFYSGAVHSFATPVAGSHGIDNLAYNEMADRRSWVAITSLLDEVFR